MFLESTLLGPWPWPCRRANLRQAVAHPLQLGARVLQHVERHVGEEDEVVEPHAAVGPVPPQQLHELQRAARGLAGYEHVALRAHLVGKGGQRGGIQGV